MDNCGAILTWKYFYGDKPIPLFLKYIEDRDMWWNKMEFTKEAFLGTTLLPKSLKLWATLFDDESCMKSIIEQGKIIKLKEDDDIQNLLKSSYTAKLKIGNKTLMVGYVNSKLYRSDLGSNLLKKYEDIDLAVMFIFIMVNIMQQLSLSDH